MAGEDSTIAAKMVRWKPTLARERGRRRPRVPVRTSARTGVSALRSFDWAGGFRWPCSRGWGFPQIEGERTLGIHRLGGRHKTPLLVAMDKEPGEASALGFIRVDRERGMTSAARMR